MHDGGLSHMDLGEYPLWLIFIVSLAVVIGAAEIGRMLGLRTKARGGDNISTLEGAVLGLLALMISFTFAMALSRFEARREAVLQEANAIGTTALRARLLPAPYNTEVLKLLRDYVQVRLDVTRRVPSAEALRAAISRSNDIQEALWKQVKGVVVKDSAMVPTGIFIQTLNEMIDNHAKRLAAAYNRLPNVVLIALYGVAAIASGFAGYAGALDAQRPRLPIALMGVLVCIVILLIQDIDRPGTGFIRVSQQPMIDVAASIAGYSD
jgi:hypothetical protein